MKRLWQIEVNRPILLLPDEAKKFRKARVHRAKIGSWVASAFAVTSRQDPRKLSRMLVLL